MMEQIKPTSEQHYETSDDVSQILLEIKLNIYYHFDDSCFSEK